MNSPAEQKIILVVDDEPANLTLLAGILKPGYKIKVAKDGERALKIAAGTPAPDLILLDVMMPGIDGYEVCARLKADPATSAVPVVFVTGMDDSADQARGLALGAAGYLHKPVDARLVIETVARLLA